MKKVLKYTLFLLASAALFTACGEKDNDPSETPSGGGSISSPEKKIKSIQCTNFAGSAAEIPELVLFQWDGDLLKSVEMEGRKLEESLMFSYNGSTEATLTFRHNGSELPPGEHHYCNIRYDGDRVLELDVHLGGGSDSTRTTFKFSYAGGTISAVDRTRRRWRWEDYDEDSERLPMSFESGNLVLYGSKGSNDGWTRYSEIKYDDKKSPFPLRAKTSFELEWMREGGSSVELFAFFFPWSDHNITSVEAVDDDGEYERESISIIYNYTYDESGYPASVDVQVKKEVYDYYRGTTETREWTYTLTYQYYE